MKKLLRSLLTLGLALSVAGCGSSSSTSTSTTASTGSDDSSTSSEENVTVALLIPYIGDQSYMDVTYNGLALVSDEFDNVDTKLMEIGTESANWETVNMQAAAEGYDIIISGNFQYESAMLTVAAQNPDIQYINFDYSDYDANNALENVYGMSYASEEIGYLAGLVAAAKSETGVIGAIGGMENPSMEAFIGGYIQAATTINPDIKVQVSWIGDFTDTAKAKEIATNMYQNGADVIWHAAGGAGNGMFEAAAEYDFWAIGVDSNQYNSFDGKPEIQSHILTSAEKRCDVAILSAVSAYMENGGSLPHEFHKMGIKEGAVALSENDNYLNNMTEEQLALVNEQIDAVLSGEVTVVDCSVDTDAYQQLVESVALN